MFKNKKLLVLFILTMAFALVVAGCGGETDTAGSDEGKAQEEQSQSGSEGKAEEMKVGFVYVGPVGDAGWTYAHDQGRKYMVEQLPYLDESDTLVVESVPENADAERVLTDLAEKGCKVIFATSFGYMDYVINVAKRYPDVVFMHCSGYKTAENVGTYFGRMYQPRYLTGLIAGMKTESNLIGYVAAHPIPEVIRGINAFTLGVRAANPEAEVKVVWTNTWYDPAAEKEAALSLLDAGADVIAQHQDTPGPQQAAQERGAFGIGYNTDMRDFAPEANMTSPVWNWGPYYVEVVEAVKNGTWKSEQYWGSIADGVVGVGAYNEDLVPEEAKKLVEEKLALMKSGELEVFAGPIKDQEGNVKVKEGESLSDEEMLGMDWFVEGVKGNIPK